MTRVLTKNPIIISSSRRSRPATGDPTVMSSSPVWRESKIVSTVNMVMKGVAPSRLLRSLIPRTNETGRVRH